MREDAAEAADAPDPKKGASHLRTGGLQTGENLLITFCLAAMVVLPLADIVLRPSSIVLPGSSALQ